MAQPISRACRTGGFTLLEGMLVLLLMGLAAGYVVFNAFSASQADRLEEQVKRLQVVMDMASDYAVLNQLEMGVRLEPRDNTYFFVYLDEEDEWQRIDGEEIYGEYTLPEEFYYTVNLNDLPWDVEDRLFDRDLFDESLSVSEEGVEIGEDEEKIPPPQILIMSSGEVTPFSLTFAYEPGFGSERPAYFRLNNEDMPPFELEGPLEQIE